jgi:hypothetical protein
MTEFEDEVIRLLKAILRKVQNKFFIHGVEPFDVN